MRGPATVKKQQNRNATRARNKLKCRGWLQNPDEKLTPGTPRAGRLPRLAAAKKPHATPLSRRNKVPHMCKFPQLMRPSSALPQMHLSICVGLGQGGRLSSWGHKSALRLVRTPLANCLQHCHVQPRLCDLLADVLEDQHTCLHFHFLFSQMQYEDLCV